jgi:hypothetical protein
MAENLVTELLDLTLPLQAILDNPEKAALLTPIEMPRAGWFYGYAKYVEAQPDQGAQLMTERLGKDLWEHFYLVFDTFVHRAQFPLQYVFADHWLLDAWIVDEETRAIPSRLWLTLLIDAYSRSILGMALLYEDPCIESIQQALRHAKWRENVSSRTWPHARVELLRHSITPVAGQCLGASLPQSGKSRTRPLTQWSLQLHRPGVSPALQGALRCDH